MRVYEYAKMVGLSNKEIISFLREKGLDINNHMAQLSEEATEMLKIKYEAASSVQKKELVKDKAPQEVALKPSQNATPAPVLSQMPSDSAKEILQKKDNNKFVAKPMSVGQLADRLSKPVSEIILALLRQGVVAAKNQILNEKIVEQIAKAHGFSVVVGEEKKTRESAVALPKKEIVGNFEERMPVVVVVGHVDHGKTTLLDYIRKTRVAAKEKGGITQHIGAYEVKTKHGNLVFLDTPGHEAFSKMRERGTRVADIAVLVVAADEGIKPQTVEAIKKIQSINVPLVVALNKIDKAAPQQVEMTKQGLTQYGLVPEEWGGMTVCVPVSAKMGTGVDDLLDVIVLQAKLLELQGLLDVPASGFIIEAKKEKGRGIVATVICQHGMVRVGDYFTAGSVTGKVTSLFDFAGRRIMTAHPSQPVQVAGFEDMPQAGDMFQVVMAEQIKKLKQSKERFLEPSRASLSQEDGINIIVKADNDSSREALIDAINKINEKAFKKVNIIRSNVGLVNENDIQLAYDTKSAIYTLHTKIEPSAIGLAIKNAIKVSQFDIIYKLLEDLELLTQTGRPVKMISKKIGEAFVLKVFDIKGIGVIAGAQVRTGRLIKDGKVIIWRGKNKIGQGVIKSLQREKKTIKEAGAGLECGFMVDDFTEWQQDDRVECYQDVPVL